jgi:two-component system, cell cycle sensor histidine kinase and response regulator CckA
MKTEMILPLELSDYFDAISDGIHIVDGNERIIYCNKAFYEWLEKMGIGIDVVGKKVTDAFPFLPAKIRDEYRQVFRSGKILVTDEVIKVNGTGMHAETRKIPVIKNQKVVNVISIFRDITRRKKSEAERANLEAQLLQAQKMEAIGQLAGGVAHDFNNILTTIIGYGDLLRMKMEKDSPLRSYVDQILSSSQRAAQVTHSLLAFSRKQVIELKPYRMNTIIRGIERLLVRLLTEDIELSIALPELDPIILADTTQIEQVLINLATNARDAMPHGGTLSVRVERIEMDASFIKAHGYGEPGHYACICVSDTGIGMAENTREKIFDPFFTTKEVGKGTGLGLSIVYGIIKQHNGYIGVTSEHRKGSTFCIYLPIVNAKVDKPKQPPLFVRGGKETLLIAEDDGEVRTLIKNVLENAGYKVIEAKDGEDAISQFTENKETIDLLISDVVMPKKNGKEVYTTIKKIKPIKVLFISGHTADVVLDKGVYGKTFNYIAKPVSPSDMLKKVREVLDA